jgi:hypothetical protein
MRPSDAAGCRVAVHSPPPTATESGARNDAATATRPGRLAGEQADRELTRSARLSGERESERLGEAAMGGQVQRCPPVRREVEQRPQRRPQHVEGPQHAAGGGATTSEIIATGSLFLSPPPALSFSLSLSLSLVCVCVCMCSERIARALSRHFPEHQPARAPAPTHTITHEQQAWARTWETRWTWAVAPPGPQPSHHTRLLSRGGCQHRWHSLVICTHGDAMTQTTPGLPSHRSSSRPRGSARGPPRKGSRSLDAAVASQYFVTRTDVTLVNRSQHGRQKHAVDAAPP